MPTTYEQIKKANDEAVRTDVKCNPYVSVAERIKAFRKVHPDGCIKTDMLSNQDGICIFKATVYDRDGQMLGTGHAFEKDGSSFINKTSYLENAETSCVGRALGMAGFGIDADVASADEVMNADLNQIANNKIDYAKVKALTERCMKDHVDIGSLCELYKVKSLEDLTEKKFANIHEHWDKISIGQKGNNK